MYAGTPLAGHRHTRTPQGAGTGPGTGTGTGPGTGHRAHASRGVTATSVVERGVVGGSEAEEETTTLEALREDITLSFEDSHMYERSAAASAPPPHNAMLKLTQTHVPGSPRQTIRYRQRELHF